MTEPIRWTVQDRYGNRIYLTQERWEHIIESINHPEMEDYEEELKETMNTGSRKQDSLNPQKYRYSKKFATFASTAANTRVWSRSTHRDFASSHFHRKSSQIESQGIV